MKPSLKLALLQYAPPQQDRDASVQRACSLINQAADQGADLVLLPEYFNTEYFAKEWDYRYLNYAEPDSGPSISRISHKAKERGVYIAVNFYEDAGGGYRYNTTALVAPNGEIIGKYRKAHPAAIKSVEKIFFRYGTQFPVFDVRGWRIGFVTSDDNFFPESMRCIALENADTVLVPNAVVKGILWEEVFQARAFENSVYVGVANRVGLEGDFDFCGKSLVVDPSGSVVIEADDHAEGVFVAELELERVEEARRRFHLYRDRRPDLYGRICEETDANLGP